MPEYINADDVRQVMRTQRWLLPSEVRELTVQGLPLEPLLAKLLQMQADGGGVRGGYEDGWQVAVDELIQYVQEEGKNARAAASPPSDEGSQTALRAHIKLGDGQGNRWHYIAIPGVTLVIEREPHIVSSLIVEWPDVT